MKTLHHRLCPRVVEKRLAQWTSQSFLLPLRYSSEEGSTARVTCYDVYVDTKDEERSTA